MKISVTEYAQHLTRLTRMCHEVLTTGEITVKSPDRAELLNILNGTWTYDQLKNLNDK